MIYVECPDEASNSVMPKLFLAGGITGCADWQRELVKEIKDLDIMIINPRRKNFDINKKDIEKEQIEWEFRHLERADAVAFWFPHETLCPITLYELGKISMTGKKLFVGVDKNYKRINDVIIQTGLIRPEVKIVFSLNELAGQIREWAGDK